MLLLCLELNFFCYGQLCGYSNDNESKTIYLAGKYFFHKLSNNAKTFFQMVMNKKIGEAESEEMTESVTLTNVSLVLV